MQEKISGLGEIAAKLFRLANSPEWRNASTNLRAIGAECLTQINEINGVLPE